MDERRGDHCFRTVCGLGSARGNILPNRAFRAEVLWRGFSLRSAALAALMLCVPAFAQIDTGSIVGTVEDASGAAVPKATVTLTNLGTNVVTTTTTNEAGGYQFNALTPGRYTR